MLLFLAGVLVGGSFFFLAYALYVLRFAEKLQFRLPWFQWFAIDQTGIRRGVTLLLGLSVLYRAGVLEVRLRDERESLIERARKTRDCWAEEILEQHGKEPDILLAGCYYEFRLVRRIRPKKSDQRSLIAGDFSWRPLAV